jgi:protein-S-isoprenylcysteine O-methyltransferase Ste14
MAAVTFDMSVRQKRILDLIEQIAVVLLYAWMTFRLWPSELSATDWYPLLILPSEGLVVALLLIRRRTDRISTNMWDWSLAAIGTTMVLLIDRGGAPVLGLLGPYLMVLGLVIHVGAKISLWRSFGLVAANRGLRLSGLYSVVRHPMYAGYIVSHVGFLLAAPALWNVAVYAVAWAVMIARIYAEERVLSEDANYNTYKTTVRYRLVPRVF